MEHDFQMLSILFNIDFIVISKKSTSSVVCRCYLKSGFFVPSSVILIFPLKTVKREQFVHIYIYVYGSSTSQRVSRKYVNCWKLVFEIILKLYWFSKVRWSVFRYNNSIFVQWPQHLNKTLHMKNRFVC